ncbi:hypothetical protein NO2_0916 [Candidatus Termititenax persephonae]|uniref:Uncharacterized protein n=1 Tax=Candidatus Termititenax persephonae TaxID=2218525 RepID=A0A388TIW7_9BACT|nr:hypothetical protein NO2_0916 [Candidatus Termititenax persephonae]
METSAVLALVSQVLWSVLLLVFILIAWQFFRILRDVAQITRRVELLTDISGWLGFFRRLSRK